MGIFTMGRRLGSDELSDESGKLVLMVGAVVMFLIATVVSWRELRYLVSGQVTDATVLSVQIETRSSRRGSHRQRVVQYSFDDAGAPRSAYCDVPMDWPYQRGQIVKVQYISRAPGYTRINGQWDWWWLLVFAGTTAYASYHGTRLLQDARAFAREQAEQARQPAPAQGPEWVTKPPRPRD